MSHTDGLDKSNQSDSQDKGTVRDGKALERQTRLSQALRDNLHRRKTQMRARKAQGSSPVHVSSDTKTSDSSGGEA